MLKEAGNLSGVIVFQNNNNSTTRKMTAFFNKQEIPYSTVKIGRNTFTYSTFMKILSLTEDGVDTILSTRSNIAQKMRDEGVDFGDLRLTELYNLMMDNPTLLKTPIAVNFEDSRLTVGIEQDMLFKFLPPNYRKELMNQRLLDSAKSTNKR